jgi:chemotaxis protein CheX
MIALNDAEAFVKSVTHYFEGIGVEAPTFEIPYTLESNTENYPLYEFSGHIGLTGTRRGALIFTCHAKLLQLLLEQVLGGDTFGEGDAVGMIAEVSNTMAGHLQTHFGKGFDITVPSVFLGTSEKLRFVVNTPVIVVPFSWRGVPANLLAGLVP